MPIVVETGEVIPNANSYVSLAEFRDFALSRNKTLSDDDEAVSALLMQAMDYLEGKEYQGRRSTVEQPLAFPRSNMVIDRSLYPEGIIPRPIKVAQMLLALDASVGISLLPSVPLSTEIVTREKIGELEVEYAKRDNSSLDAPILAADIYIKPFLYSGNSLFSFAVGRA